MYFGHVESGYCATETIPCLFSRHVLDGFCFGEESCNSFFTFGAALKRHVGSGNRLVLDDFFPAMIDFQNKGCVVWDKTTIGENIHNIRSLPLPPYHFFSKTFGAEAESMECVDKRRTDFDFSNGRYEGVENHPSQFAGYSKKRGKFGEEWLGSKMAGMRISWCAFRL